MSSYRQTVLNISQHQMENGWTNTPKTVPTIKEYTAGSSNKKKTTKTSTSKGTTKTSKTASKTKKKK